ncbi:hypothetical protein MSBRW_3479 [Methanosarcina barkeri str. Wiesmoor]|uniref:Uncharacterized protein n=2 Tax=Methanosarcina barkeri TaxID=2208 RepID=A0A0E3QQF1_METBA|nr:hypothetical protein MSBRW_3479 [Methanosarcina barkeri str. Wiesmoor]
MVSNLFTKGRWFAVTIRNNAKYGVILVGVLSLLMVGFLTLSDSSQAILKTVEQPDYSEATNIDKPSNNVDTDKLRTIGISGSLEEYTYDDLNNHADTVIIGKVKEILPPKWNTEQTNKSFTEKIKRGELIYTDIIISVDKYLKNPLSSNEVTVRVVGGTIGNITMTSDIEPSFKPDEKVLLYLSNDTYPYTKDVGSEHFVVTGYVQGKFKLTDDGKAVRPDETVSQDELLSTIKDVA